MENSKRTMSEHALCAKAIREELKRNFPEIKFKVNSESFSMGNAVRIHYTDGPTKEKIEAITNKYQYGHFNSMEDIYENNNDRDDIPQAKYVTVGREMSEEIREKIISEIKIKVPNFDYSQWCDSYGCHGSELVYREYRKRDF